MAADIGESARLVEIAQQDLRPGNRFDRTVNAGTGYFGDEPTKNQLRRWISAISAAKNRAEV